MTIFVKNLDNKENSLNNREVRCTGFILNEKNQLLLLEHENRNKQKYWWFPGGGLENNEEHEDGLKREIKEELNLEVCITDSFMLKGLNPERTYKQHFVGIIRIDSNSSILLEEDGIGKLIRYKWFDIINSENCSEIILDKDIYPIILEAEYVNIVEVCSLK